MMIYQQEMLTTTFAPLDVASPTARRKNLTGSSKKHRSVNFSACTKNGALHPHDEDGHDSSQQQRAGVKRRSSTPRVLIPNALFRSPSELQLSVDEEVAEARDYNFFARLVSGIAERSTSFPHPSTAAAATTTAAGAYSADTESCLTHILQTRHEPPNTGRHDDDDAGGCSILEAQQHQEQEEQEQNEQDWFTASCASSTTSSSSHAMYYQHDFDEHTDSPYEAEEGAENDCIFDLEL